MDRHDRPRRAGRRFRADRMVSAQGGLRVRGEEAVGLDSAQRQVLGAEYGPWLLGFVAAGLIAFGVYSISEARYRRI